ncbi:hypothetical protein RFI_03770 [Reticulomyxa filosa]|uniref:Uncharacterized protein n=1 Tax=Reticulomyxa filosa TaxID=46433 RepID=X6P5H0_RETFI|nr:hypothetical protein RFI_03770 [Reticulomyxa filosa]|eukprot:ETO33339.1 hypothetical protein RFI_03770 [Reticulomyxa filosa]
MENTNALQILPGRLSCTLQRVMRALSEIFEAHSNTWSARNFDEILLQIISQVQRENNLFEALAWIALLKEVCKKKKMQQNKARTPSITFFFFFKKMISVTIVKQIKKTVFIEQVHYQFVTQFFLFLLIQHKQLKKNTQTNNDKELNRASINEVSWRPIVLEVKMRGDEMKVVLLNSQSLSPRLRYVPPYTNTKSLKQTTLEPHIEALSVCSDPERVQNSFANHCGEGLLSPLTASEALYDAALPSMSIDGWEVFRPLDADDFDNMSLFNNNLFYMDSALALVEMSQSPFDE